MPLPRVSEMASEIILNGRAARAEAEEPARCLEDYVADAMYAYLKPLEASQNLEIIIQEGKLDDPKLNWQDFMDGQEVETPLTFLKACVECLVWREIDERCHEEFLAEEEFPDEGPEGEVGLEVSLPPSQGNSW